MQGIFQAGERATRSGLYRAIHWLQHAETHYVTVLCGDVFPSCLECFEHVQFELAVPAGYVAAHPRFNTHEL
jgi:hypothetical protein